LVEVTVGNSKQKRRVHFVDFCVCMSCLCLHVDVVVAVDVAAAACQVEPIRNGSATMLLSFNDLQTVAPAGIIPCKPL
jgi:hypothetical protein